ncbi:MAG: hypothetical protein BWK80_14965 [Desulfobacteraceae bacterium IS3]|nr:MAG: hypothetical protein BWK80_14965 [Desulfobacteraceae bacterium IS3]
MRKYLRSLLRISLCYKGLSALIFIAAVVSNIYAAEIVLYDGVQSVSGLGAPDRQGWFSNLSVSVSALCGLCEKCCTISPDSFCSCDPAFVIPCASSVTLKLCEITRTSAQQKAEQGMTNLNTVADVKDIAGYFSKLPDTSLLPDTSGVPAMFPPECSDFALIPGISEIRSFSAAHPNMPMLDRFIGFTLRFKVQLVTETSEIRDQAGFSVIVICNDKKGLELGFRSGEIRVRDDNPDFTAGETANPDTASLMPYTLVIQGDGYKLYADSDRLKEPILSGRLRDYTAYQKAFFPNSYNTPDFLFFGDSSTLAGAEINLASVSVRIHGKRGDIDGDGHIGLADAVLAFQVCAGTAALSGFPEYRISDADVNGDGRIGLEEAVYVLRIEK